MTARRKGELELAHAHARIGAELYRLLAELRRRSGHETGEIADGRFTPKLDTVFRQAKLSRSAGFRALADAQRLGWFTRFDTADPAKVAGCLSIGRDAEVRECVCGCGRSLTGMRPDARYYSGACRLRAARSRKASRASPDNRYSPSPDNRDMAQVDVTDEVSQCNGSSVTPSPDNRYNPQVRDPETTEAYNKSSTRSKGLDRGAVSPRPSGWLLRRIPPAVAAAPGGGCSRADLAAVLHVSEYDQVFVTSLMVCYRRGQVDFAWGYVVAPPRQPEVTTPDTSDTPEPPF